MSKSELRAPKGTFDILPGDESARTNVETKAREILGRAGYSRIETPTFEQTELFARGVGESTDVVQKEMYSFKDMGDRSMTLRPEGTAPICRAYVEHGMHKLAQPVKLWYLSSFFRQERPQAGRFRQFWQIGAEAIGSDSPLVDAESILLLSELLEVVGVSGTRLRISSLGSPETRAKYREELVEFLREREEELSPEVRKRIDLNPLRAFDSDDPGTRYAMENAPRLLDQLEADDHEHFETVLRLLDAAEVPYEIDSTLVRGLDYYTRTVFEFTSDALGAQSGVGGGGRYDGLVEQLGGPPTSAIGWAAGIERMLLAASDEEASVRGAELFIAVDGEQSDADSLRLARSARSAGIATEQELAGRSLKGQFKQADRLGVSFIVVLSRGGAELKEMSSGEQQAIALDEIVPEVLKRKTA